MLIDCPACARSYHVSRAEIGDAGRTVICPRCDIRWFVYGDGTTTLSPAPDDLTTASFSGRPAVMPFDDAATTGRRSFWRAARPAMTAVSVVLAAMIAIGARQRIVQAVPRLSGLYADMGLPVNVRGLEITDLAPNRLDAGTLAVTGAIHNVDHRRVAVPRLVYEVRDTTGTTLLTWTEKAPAKTLGTGRMVTFVSMPHQVPPESRSLLVRFETEEPSPPLRLARRMN